MKIPFDIKYRPQIESGEYKVKTKDGSPARIICWDSPIDKERPIIAIVFDYQIEQYKADGRYDNDFGTTNYDLFIITPEPELTEFEADVMVILLEFVEEVDANDVKRISKELLELAKKELCKDCPEKRCNDYSYEGPTPHTWFPSCYHGGPCTNPMHDCINCPRQSTDGISTTTGTSTAKVEG